MGFIIHVYIIFGTSLLTDGPVQIVVFLPISVCRRKGISNGMKPLRGTFFGTNMIHRTWSGRQATDEEATR